MDGPHRASAMKGIGWIVGVIVAAGLLVVALRFSSRALPFRWEVALSRVSTPFAQSEICAASAPLDRLVARLYPLYPTDREFEIAVKEVRRSDVNALTYLGGRIFLFEGLVRDADSPAEVAGVLAHEIEHVRQRHVTDGLFDHVLLALAGRDSQIMPLLLRLSFSRHQEEEADDGGLRRLHDAHIDTGALGRFFQKQRKKLSPPAMLSTHPSDASRAAIAARYVGGRIEPVLSASDWSALRAGCGSH